MNIRKQTVLISVQSSLKSHPIWVTLYSSVKWTMCIVEVLSQFDIHQNYQ